MVDLVRVLAGAVFAAQQRMIGERFILEHFDAFAAARFVFRCFRHRIQLSGLVLDGELWIHVRYQYVYIVSKLHRMRSIQLLNWHSFRLMPYSDCSRLVCVGSVCIFESQLMWLVLMYSI